MGVVTNLLRGHTHLHDRSVDLGLLRPHHSHRLDRGGLARRGSRPARGRHARRARWRRPLERWDEFQMLMAANRAGRRRSRSPSCATERSVTSRVDARRDRGPRVPRRGTDCRRRCSRPCSRACGESFRYVGLVVRDDRALCSIPRTFPDDRQVVHRRGGRVGHGGGGGGGWARSPIAGLDRDAVALARRHEHPAAARRSTAARSRSRSSSGSWAGRCPARSRSGFSAVGAVLLFSLIGYVMYLDMMRYAI